jgi:SAM-dependent methyltransferase
VYQGEEGAWAPLDAALAAYRAGRQGACVVVRADVGDEERLPASHFFRPVEAMSEVERRALAEARGRVLDVGAGAGAHAAPLAAAGHTVTALEILPGALAELRARGISDARAGGLEALRAGERFDTVLLLMNGLGLPGTLQALDGFLAELEGHLEEGGSILADSTDPGRWEGPDDGRYVGEIHMQLAFEGRAGPPFPFLFVDADTLAQMCTRVGLTCRVLEREEDGRYLACMERGGGFRRDRRP